MEWFKDSVGKRSAFVSSKSLNKMSPNFRSEFPLTLDSDTFVLRYDFPLHPNTQSHHTMPKSTVPKFYVRKRIVLVLRLLNLMQIVG